jgi:DNA repair protein RecO (recombination protein O)
VKIQDQPAYILHQRAYRDTSQIVELLTRDHGRVAVVSRGSRGPKSRLRAVMQPFRPLSVCWTGKGELVTLTSAEPASRSLPRLTGNALPCAFYINEILIRMLHRFDVHDEIFRLYETTLYALTEQQQLESSLRLFEKQLLQYLGFGINLSVDADTGEPVREQSQYSYFVEHGPVLAPAGSQDLPQLGISGASLLAFDRNELSSPTVCREVKSLMRHVLAYYLGGKPLKSRELFRGDSGKKQESANERK